MSKIHQILLAANVHATTHRGYYPLAGFLPGARNDFLLDPDSAKYDYDDVALYVSGASVGPGGVIPLGGSVSGTTVLPAYLQPITNSLALVMRARYLTGLTNQQYGSTEANSTLFVQNFLCPSQSNDPTKIFGVNTAKASLITPLPVLYYTGDEVGTSNLGVLYLQSMSYVWNEYVLGWDMSSYTVPGNGVTQSQERYATHRLRGRADHVTYPERTVFVADGMGCAVVSGTLVAKASPNRTAFPGATLVTTGAPDTTNGNATAPVTMDHALTTNDPLAGSPGSFDLKRHNGMINIGFCDGHGEVMYITKGDLKKVYLVPPTH